MFKTNIEYLEKETIIWLGGKSRTAKMDTFNYTLDDVEGYCEKCGYISPDFVESGLHALECEGVNERHKDYKCEKCKDNTSPIWGIETREFCSLVKTAYEKVVHFRPNTHTQCQQTTWGKSFTIYRRTPWKWLTRMGLKITSDGTPI